MTKPPTVSAEAVWKRVDGGVEDEGMGLDPSDLLLMSV